MDQGFSPILSVINSENLQTAETSIGIKQIIGCILMIFIAGLSSLAGLGGGGPNVVILILFFDVLPKQATIMVFACILGSSFGNIVNQTQRALNGQPTIQYSYAFVTIPIMLFGSILGVFVNKLLPSFITASVIIGVALHSLPKIYHRFKDAYKRESQQIMHRQHHQRLSQIIKQSRINPFSNELNLKIFTQLAVLILCYIALSLLRGSENIPSLLGVSNCSLIFWLIQIVILCLTWTFFLKNKHLIEVWNAPDFTLGEELFEREDLIQQNVKKIIRDGMFAGIFSGLGLGGGIFLVPLYRHLKLSPIQATSTCVFSVFITSAINVVQAIFLGALSFKQFFFLFGTTGIGSLLISIFVSSWLRKINRTSMVELLLFILLVMANCILPYSLWLKYENSGRNLSIIFGFGSLC